ncbi:MAG: hypothetical protein QXU18_07015 [Thermoplasmatales archaeon]
MANSLKCGNCGSESIKEVITGGMRQTVYWDEGYVVKSETKYEKSDENSIYTCEKCGAKL